MVTRSKRELLEKSGSCRRCARWTGGVHRQSPSIAVDLATCRASAAAHDRCARRPRRRSSPAPRRPRSATSVRLRPPERPAALATRPASAAPSAKPACCTVATDEAAMSSSPGARAAHDALGDEGPARRRCRRPSRAIAGKTIGAGSSGISKATPSRPAAIIDRTGDQQAIRALAAACRRRRGTSPSSRTRRRPPCSRRPAGRGHAGPAGRSARRSAAGCRRSPPAGRATGRCPWPNAAKRRRSAATASPRGDRRAGSSTSAATAPTNRPTFASGWTATAVSDMAAIATQISATRRPGTRAPRRPLSDARQGADRQPPPGRRRGRPRRRRRRASRRSARRRRRPAGRPGSTGSRRPTAARRPRAHRLSGKVLRTST